MRRMVMGMGVTLFVLCSVGRGLTVDKASVAMGWLFTGTHAPFFLAEERGYYKAEAIDPTILRGYGSGDTVRRVNLGDVTFGFIDSPAAIVGRARGVQVKMLAILMAKSPHVLFSLKKTGIRTPADLKGKSIAAGKAESGRILFPALAKINGLDEGSVNWMDTSPEVKGPMLLTGKVNAITNIIVNLVPLEPKAKELGEEIEVMWYRDWGLNIYGNGLYATDKLIAERVDLVRRFVRASMKGFAAALEEPEPAVDALIRKVAALTPASALKELKITNDLLLSEDAYKEGLGTVNRSHMSTMIDVLTQYMDLPRKISVDEIFTNEFLPRIIPKKGG